MGKGKNKRKDAALRFAPINLNPLIYVGAAALAGILGAGELGKSDSNIQCDVVISQAIEEQKADPLVDLRYSGPAEEQCGVNNIIDEWP